MGLIPVPTPPHPGELLWNPSPNISIETLKTAPLHLETLQKGNCFLISVLWIVFDLFVHHRAEQAQHLFAFNSLFYFMQTETFPGNALGWKGSLKIIQLLTCPEAPAASSPDILLLWSCWFSAGMWKESWCWNAAGTLWLHHSLPSSTVGFHFPRIISPDQVFSFSTLWAPAWWGDKNEQGMELVLAAALGFLFTLYFPLPRVMVRHRLRSFWGWERGLKVCGLEKGDNFNS